MTKVVVLLYGGLGNQLFQYIMGEYIRNKYNLDVYYDLSSFGLLPTYRQYELNEVVRDIPIYKSNKLCFSRYTHILRRILQYALKMEPGVAYYNELRDKLDENIFITRKHKLVYLDGYWQNKKYYEWCVKNIDGFRITPFDEIPDQLKDDFNYVKSNTCVSLHVRRGDYLLKENSSLMAFCSPKYYTDSLDYILSKVNVAKLVVFSDDPEWVKQNLTFKLETKVIENKDVSPIWYIYMMSCCKHHIISNSTFSWWGAVIGSTINSITIAPSKWFNKRELPSLYFDNWTIIKN